MELTFPILFPLYHIPQESNYRKISVISQVFLLMRLREACFQYKKVNSKPLEHTTQKAISKYFSSSTCPSYKDTLLRTSYVNFEESGT